MRPALLFIACVIAVTATAAEAARRTKRVPPRAAAQEDPFKACDLQVREYLREGGTWLTPTEIKVDEARLTLAITHAFGQSGRSVPRPLRGDSEEERRQVLRAQLAELREAVEAAKAGKAWFLIVPKTMLATAARPAARDNGSPWHGLLVADVRGKCRTIAHYPNIAVDKLPPEVRSEMEL
jgi:hypothetical protein